VDVIGDTVRIDRAHTLKPMRGRRSILDNDKSAGPGVDRALMRAVTQARRWGDMLSSGEVASIQEFGYSRAALPYLYWPTHAARLLGA
jgi:hypothetical protein